MENQYPSDLVLNKSLTSSSIIFPLVNSALATLDSFLFLKQSNIFSQGLYSDYSLSVWSVFSHLHLAHVPLPSSLCSNVTRSEWLHLTALYSIQRLKMPRIKFENQRSVLITVLVLLSQKPLQTVPYYQVFLFFYCSLRRGNQFCHISFQSFF